MAGFGLRKNLVFEWDGASFRIDRLQPNGEVLLERCEDGQLAIVARDKLLAEYALGNVCAKESETHATSVAVFSRPLDELPDSVKTEAIRRRRYLEGVLAHGAPAFTKGYLQPLIDAVAADIGDAKPPSLITFYRWHARYRVAKDARALIPRLDLRGSKHPRQSDRVLQLVAEATEEAYRASPLATCQNIYTRLVAKIGDENCRVFQGDQIKVPSIRTLYRLLARVDVYETTCRKEGKAAADKRFRVNKAGVQTTRVLERVEIDHTPLDLFLIDEKTWLPLGRPTLTVVIDHFSRMLLGYYLSYENPSAAAVVGALRHAILPKSPVAEAMPNLKIEHPWPCYGRPEVMVVDNGLEFHGIDLESVAYDLGIRIQYCPKHQPRFKGVVERYLKTINYFFAHQLPGTSFSRFYLRGDYDPQKCAVLTLAEFQHIFEKWVLDVYAQTLHRGLKTTPWSRWQEGVARYEPELPNELRTLQRRIGLVEERSLRQDGITLAGIRYSGDALLPILRAFGAGTKVRVLYDPENLGEIQVWAPDSADPISVLAVDQTYAKGLTAKQNKVIRQFLREQGASSENHVALERARNELARSIEELLVSRKQTARRRGAALSGISSNQPQGSARQITSGGTPPTSAKTALFNTAHLPEKALPPLLPTFQMQRRQGGKQ